MTTDEILTIVRTAGIVLEARGDTLHVEAPWGALTPELRALLVQHKPDILDRLAPVTQFVSLRGGLVLPLPAVLLALDLERRGFQMRVDVHQEFCIEPPAALTDADVVAIRRWRRHLMAIVAYNADEHGPTQ